MVTDNIRNAKNYYALGGRIKKALLYLQATDFSGMAPGRYEIESDDVFALIQQYDPKPVSEGKLEAHRKYIDVQYLYEGCEEMGYADIDSLDIKIDYDDEKDVVIYKGECDMLTYNKGMFAIFFPQDAHMPCIEADKHVPVKKIVVKVKCE